MFDDKQSSKRQYKHEIWDKQVKLSFIGENKDFDSSRTEISTKYSTGFWVFVEMFSFSVYFRTKFHKIQNQQTKLAKKSEML